MNSALDSTHPAEGSSPTHNRVIHFEGLNGIRAIAAMAVVISHTTISLGEFGLNAFLFGSTPDGTPMGLGLANSGVSMFFALSGFLITYLLLAEKQKQPIDVRKFYIRRVLRIHPLYYSYLLICIAVMFSYGIPFSMASLAFYIFLAANVPVVLNISIPLLAHYWSLGVEEQFYLFFPWVVKKVKHLPWFLGGLAVLLILAKLFFRSVDLGWGDIPFRFVDITRFPCMMVGALGAWYFYGGSAVFRKVAASIPVQLVSWAIILLVAVNRFNYASIVNQEIIALITVCVIIAQITRTNRLLPLNLKFLDFLGKVSYGIYVIHPLVIFLLAKSRLLDPVSGVSKYMAVYASVLLVTVGTAYLSYEYFEKRFLRLKEQFTTVPSASAGTQVSPQPS